MLERRLGEGGEAKDEAGGPPAGSGESEALDPDAALGRGGDDRRLSVPSGSSTSS